MLLFLGKNFNFESIESNRLHKVWRLEDRVRKLIELTDMFFENDGAREVKRLAELVQDRRPAL